MSVALIEVSDWIQDLIAHQGDFVSEVLPLLITVQEALSIEFDGLKDYDNVDLKEAFDEYLDEVYEWYEVVGVSHCPSDIAKLDPCSYTEGLRDWQDQCFVELGGSTFNIDEICANQWDYIGQARRAFETEVLRQFPDESDEHGLLLDAKGKDAFFPTFKALWERREAVATVKGMGVDRPHIRMM